MISPMENGCSMSSNIFMKEVVTMKPFFITHNNYSFEVLSSRNLKLLDPSSLSSNIVLFNIILDSSQPFVNWARKTND
jgi:hypothetical protein